MKIADDHCPTCDHPIEVFVPQPYASGPELLEALEALHEATCHLLDFDKANDLASAAIAKAKGGRNG